MKRNKNLILKSVVTILVLCAISMLMLVVLDGKVFDLPNHKVVVSAGDFHVYPKAITFEFKEAK